MLFTATGFYFINENLGKSKLTTVNKISKFHSKINKIKIRKCCRTAFIICI